MFLRNFLLVFSLSALLAGCYQVHSDDGMRSVPVTNNPNVIPHTAQNEVPPGIAY